MEAGLRHLTGNHSSGNVPVVMFLTCHELVIKAVMCLIEDRDHYQFIRSQRGPFTLIQDWSLNHTDSSLVTSLWVKPPCHTEGTVCGSLYWYHCAHTLHLNLEMKNYNGFQTLQKLWEAFSFNGLLALFSACKMWLYFAFVMGLL